MNADVTSEEDEAGNVTAVGMRQALGKSQNLVMTGTVDGKQVRIKVGGEGLPGKAWNNPWNPESLGLVKGLSLAKAKKVKPGDAYDYCYFEPQVTSVVTVHSKVGKPELVAVAGLAGRTLLPVVETADPLKIGTGDKEQTIAIPTGTFYLDPETRDVVLTRMDVPSVGPLTLVRVAKVAALAANGKAGDSMVQQAWRSTGACRACTIRPSRSSTKSS